MLWLFCHPVLPPFSASPHFSFLQREKTNTVWLTLHSDVYPKSCHFNGLHIFPINAEQMIVIPLNAWDYFCNPSLWPFLHSLSLFPHTLATCITSYLAYPSSLTSLLLFSHHISLLYPSLLRYPFFSKGEQRWRLWGGWGFSQPGCHIFVWGTFSDEICAAKFLQIRAFIHSFPFKSHWCLRGNVILVLDVSACEPRMTCKSHKYRFYWIKGCSCDNVAYITVQNCGICVEIRS